MKEWRPIERETVKGSCFEDIGRAERRWKRDGGMRKEKHTRCKVPELRKAPTFRATLRPEGGLVGGFGWKRGMEGWEEMKRGRQQIVAGWGDSC